MPIAVGDSYAIASGLSLWAGVAPRVFGGALPYVFGLNTTNYLLGWPHALSWFGATEYQYRINGGSWVSTGMAPYVYVTGRTASTVDWIDVRAINGASVPSAPISLTVALPAIGSPNVIVSVIGSTTSGYPAPHYASGQAWADAAGTLAGSSNLTTANVRLEGLLLPGEYTSRVEMISLVTSPSQCRRLSVFPGASFVDHPNRKNVALRYSPTQGAALLINSTTVTPAVGLHEANSRVSRLQIQCNGAGANPGSSGTHTSAVGGNTYQDQMLIESAILDNVISGNYGPHYIRNSLVVSLAGSSIIRMVEEGNGCLHYGVTFVAANARAPSFSVSRHPSDVYKNCAILNCDEIIAYSAGDYTAPGPTFVNCLTDANPALHTGGVLPSGCTAVSYAGAGFANNNLASRDFRLTQGSPLRNAGIADTTHSPIDILGTVRPISGAIDVGAWQYTL